MKTIHILSNAEVIAMLQSDIDMAQPRIESIVNSSTSHTPDQVQAFRELRMMQINAKHDIDMLNTTTAVKQINSNALIF